MDAPRYLNLFRLLLFELKLLQAQCSCTQQHFQNVTAFGNNPKILKSIPQDINYGVIFSRRFIDSQESNETAAGLMNLHNNEAGRRVCIYFTYVYTNSNSVEKK